MSGRLATWIATWFGCGYVPKGPGTAGALGGLAVACLLPGHMPWLVAGTLLPFIWAADTYAKRNGAKDPQEVVADEVIGQWITLLGATSLASPWTWLMAFALFRAFDILKPPPVRWFEKLPGGVGIVMDDVAAGIYGALVLRLLT
ncbi:MAG: phosphatidylglycerophosphatase A [Acidobacteria bacterium]|nr:phosphatidylglycerophosphatase A [Acidobacteriota bacterium]